MSEPLAYLNGRICPISQCVLPVTDLGIVMGATLTEMARTFKLEVIRLKDHVDRLFRSIKVAGFEVDLTRDALADLVVELVDHNSSQLPAGHELGVSVFVTAGASLIYSGLAGLPLQRKPTVCVHTFPLPFELWADKYVTGLHLVVPSIRHIAPETLDPKLKCRSRMHWYLADEQARLVDPGAQALLLDQQDNLTETSTSNFYLVRNGQILTPTSRNTLQGVSQTMVAELAAKLGIPYRTDDLQSYDAINADEAFTSSTPTCLLPVARINQRTIGDGQPGPVFSRLLAAWSEQVGLDIVGQMQHGAAERRAEMARHA